MKPKFAIYLGLLAGAVFVAWLFGAPTGFMLSAFVAVLTFCLGACGRYSRGYFDGWEDAGKAWRERGHGDCVPAGTKPVSMGMCRPCGCEICRDERAGSGNA